VSRAREPSLGRELLLRVAAPLVEGALKIALGVARREHEAAIRRREAEAAAAQSTPKRRGTTR